MPQNKLELLSPAGSMDALLAAFANGADAVYLGAAAFGARASAGFDESMLREALRIAHLHRKRIYVTVNILIKERELADVRRTLSLLSYLGADAVLVQDAGVLKICREEYPELPVHASTQMAIHNAEGVRFLQSLGVARAVMARECSMDELKAAAATGMEIEAFCHGAMCVSCSGQCLLSSMIGGRSGNRGRCAQPCRLPYQYQGKDGAWLSPRDLCARDELLKMADAGVYSFKIEGRLKRPEYVAVVTRAYRQALDGVLENRFSPMDKAEKEALTQIFSRGGFTLGYPGDQQDAGIIDPSRVTPVGIPIGQVLRAYRKGNVLLCDAKLTKDLHNGDGLEIGDQSLIYSGPDIPAGGTASVRLHQAVQAGGAVRRTEDEAQLAAARATFAIDTFHAALPIPFDTVLTAYPRQPLRLTVTDGESAVEITGEDCQIAQNKALDQASARRSLEKCGGTPYVLRGLTVNTAGAFVAASALNALRREALDRLTEARIAAQPRQKIPAAAYDAPKRRIPAPRLIVKTDDFEEISDLLAAGAHEVLYQPRDMREEKLLPALQRWPNPKQTRLCLPPQCRLDTQRRLKQLTREYGVPVCLFSPNQLGGFGQSVMAGEGVPVMNGEAANMLSHAGCESVTLSRELSRQEVMDLPQNICEYILPVYGRARLMLLNHCPMRTSLGLKQGRQQCDLCDWGKGARGTAMVDRMNVGYSLQPMRLPEGCLIGLMSPKPLHLSGQLTGLPPLSWLLAFSDEDPNQRLLLIRHYRALMEGKTPPAVTVDGTIGRFKDGVL